MSSPITKQLAPGVTLIRTEDVNESCIVYTVNNTASTIRWCFTFDFRESTNFYLRPIAKPFASTTKDTHKGLLRRTIVEPNTTLEVARLTVVNPKLKSSIQVHYGWEEKQQSSTPNNFTDFGTTQIKTEALASDVDLITARTDLKDGHSKFVYRIKSKRRESLKVILDFAGSKNLALVSTGVHNRLSRFIFSSKNGKSGKSKNSTLLKKEVRVTRGTTRVAKLRTVVPRQGWALNHNVTFEIKTLVNDLTKPTHTEEIVASDSKNALQHCASAPPSTAVQTRSQLPKRRPVRRISMTRASAGFERGLLIPPPVAKNTSALMSVDTSVDIKDTDLLTEMRPPPVVPVVGTHPAPSRMSWLDAEIFQHVNGSDGSETVVPNSKSVTFARDSMDINTSEESVENVDDDNDGRCSAVPFVQPPTSLVAAHAASNNQVYQMLESISLQELYYTRFESEAFHGIQLLMALANDSKIDFRSTLKEIGVDKAGHREQILQAVLAME